MAIYTVHASPADTPPGERQAARLVFVKEGFCWPGIAVPLPWLLFRRMWIVAAFYLLAMVVIALLAREERLAPVAMALGFLVPLLLGFEGNDLRRWSLARRGFAMLGVVEADSLEEADIRFFAGRRSDRAPTPSTPIASALKPAAAPPSVIGLFPVSEGGR